MHIRLFVDHTALLMNDRRVEVTIEPACEGVLEIEGEQIPVKNGSASPYLPRIIGHVGVTFTTSAGVRYKGINPHMKDGVPFSALDYAGGYASMLIRMDDMAREIRQLTQELLDGAQFSVYTDAACTEAYDPYADTDSDLTIYVKWGE